MQIAKQLRFVEERIDVPNIERQFRTFILLGDNDGRNVASIGESQFIENIRIAVGDVSNDEHAFVVLSA